MRKCLLIILMMSIITMIGCNDKGYDDYKRALGKTNDLKSYELYWDMKVEMDYNYEGLDQDDIEMIKNYKNMEMEMISVEDHRKGYVDSEVYISYGGIGFNANYFVSDQGSYLSLPFVEGYIDISDVEGEDFIAMDYKFLISKETTDEIQKLWIETISSENVFKGDSILVDTKDGSVKATKYTIEINDEIFKEFISKTLVLIIKDEEFVEYLKSSELQEEFNVIEFIEEIKKFRLDKFLYEIYVDVDGYIVSEDIEVVIDSEQDYLSGIDFKISSNISNINKEFDFDFPYVSEDDLMKFGELKELDEFKEYLPVEGQEEKQ
ncbi:MAG: hypothetical protein KAH05_08280 [Clostridiales bacterium]|nr:hypothetical protein [Clostridiales bacterium]